MVSASRWTVTTWNLQGSKATDLDRVASELTVRRPDVVLLQEVRQGQAIELGGRLEHRVHWAFKHQAWAPLFPRTAEGAAILTPHRLEGTGSQVVSDRTRRRDWRRRIVVWAVTRRDDGSAVRVVNAHLSPHDLRVERLTEAARVADLVASWPPVPPTIVGGDFNDHGEPETLDRLPGTEHVPSPPTNPANDPTNVLDHVLTPATARDVELEVPQGGPGWDGVSDHLPVTIAFTLASDDR